MQIKKTLNWSGPSNMLSAMMGIVSKFTLLFVAVLLPTIIYKNLKH